MNLSFPTALLSNTGSRLAASNLVDLQVDLLCQLAHPQLKWKPQLRHFVD